MKVKAKKSISLIVVAVLAVAIGLGALSVSHNAKSKKQFVADGFILDAPAEAAVTEVNKQHYFSQGTKYQEKFDTKVLFKDASGQDVSIDINQFLHYADGSLGSFTKGVIMNLDDVEAEQFGYYSITPNTLLLKNGNDYEMSSRGEKMTISEFVWKISDTDYMIVSPEVTLKLGTSQEITLPNYAQLKYVDSGIVRIIHQQGTYQTVSADSFLYTQGGAELNLVGKNFYQNGEPGLSLDSMAIDDEDYIELDENTDSPELKIPTFNVINGKDGAAGTVGEDGVEGEQGEDGEDGEEGQEGEEGMAGEEGMEGAQGNIGEDGVEGNAGVMGYDGAEGKEGKDAENSADDIVPTDLLSRPTVSVDTADSYEVTAGSAKMEINLKDPDSSWIQGETSIDIIDRNTMESIFYDRSQYATEEEAREAAEAKAKELGQSFENANGNIMINQSNLKPDTEYIIVVNGQYVVEKDSQEAMYGTLFSKVFKTDALGIVIAKDVVTDSSVSVTTTKNASNVASYSVHFFVYNDAGEKETIGLYNDLTDSGTYVFDALTPTGDDKNGAMYRATDYELKSNTTVYAEIANVQLTDDSLVDAGDTAIELKTLKKKPYHKETDDTETSVTAMQPTITLNAKNHSLTVSLDKVEDDDNGITGYRYELYRWAEYDAAITDNALADLTPAYTKEAAAAADQTFSIPEGESGDFIARVVVEFNDNEKDVEYSTLFSAPTTMSASSSDLTVEFDNVTRHPDRITGYIKIKDVSGAVAGHVDGSNPLLLTITSEYDDILTPPVTLQSSNDGTYLYYFEQDGLRKQTTYTLSLSGPWDTDGDGDIIGLEKKTYLAGYRAETINTYAFSMAYRNLDANTPALFGRSFYLTMPEGTSYTAADYEYEANIMHELKFELIHVLENGVEQKMGNDATVKDSAQYENEPHDSVFYYSCWVDRGNVVECKNANDEKIGLEVTENAGVADLYVLKPESFGLDNNDSRFFSGGTFKIRAKVATDYTTHKNEIPFVDGEDVCEFTVKKKHVVALDPTSQVRVEPITNLGARDGYKEDDKADDTVVGLRFQTEYPYTDINEITYYIYEMPENDLTSYAGVTFGAADAPGTLVWKGTQSIGQSGGWRAPEVELYFDGTRCFVDGPAVAGALQNGSAGLTRGKRYYIRYEVEANENMIDCDGNNQPDTYPDCAYAGGTVPYYRSSIIELAKQIPSVSRYPYTSGDVSATWMYHVVDPDNAIEGGFILKQAATADAVATQTGSDIAITGTMEDYKADYKTLPISGLTDNNYYSVVLNYKLSSVADVKTIASVPVQFKKKITSADGISAKGVAEDAIVNEGGYRYKLTLQGTDIKKYAAFKVVFTDTAGSGKSVVFDPVYPSTIGQMQDGNDMAILYMDASPVKTLVDSNVTEVKVSVDGYFTTYESGMNGYAAATVNGDSIDSLSLYALKTYQEDGSSYYRRMTNGNWVSAQEVAASLIIPGAENNGNGFVLTDESADINMRYPTAPLSVVPDNFQAMTENVVIDENGMRAVSIANTSYYTIEKLAKKTGISFANSDNVITIGSLLPAVSLESQTMGATSAYMKFKTLGTGATPDSKIYAKVYNNAGDLLKVEKKTEAETGVEYYEVVKDGNVAATTNLDYYKDTAFKNNHGISIKGDAGSTYAELRIRGLEKGTEYKVQWFAYDAAGNIVDLYSFDHEVTGYSYGIRTLDAVQITVTDASYIYDSYTSKTAQFRFAIPGDEGTGKTIYYKVVSADGTQTIIDEDDVQPLGSQSYPYYSQLTGQNNPINLPMGPSDAIRLGTTYKLIVTAKDNTDDSELGSKEVTFTTPASLKEPTFTITATSAKTDVANNLVRISATIGSTDAQRSIINDQYTVYLKDKDGNAIPGVASQTVTRTAGGTSKTNVVEFTDIDGGKEYVIEVVAEVDTDNNTSSDTTISKKYTVTALGNTTATFAAAATLSQIQVLFTNLQGFDNVSSILLTAYEPETYTQINIPSITVTPEMVAANRVSEYLSWNVTKGGEYQVYAQYCDAEGNLLGNGETVAIVSSDEQGDAAAAGISMMSLRRSAVMSAAPDANAGTNTSTTPDANAGTNTSTTPDANAGTNTSTNTSTTPDANAGTNTNTTPDANAGTNTSTTPDANANTNTSTTPDANANTETTTTPTTGTDNNGSGTEGQSGSNTTDTGSSTNTGSDAGNGGNSTGDTGAGTTE